MVGAAGSQQLDQREALEGVDGGDDQDVQGGDVYKRQGVGVSATGQIDSRKGIVAGTCGNFPNYINSPIQAELERRCV